MHVINANPASLGIRYLLMCCNKSDLKKAAMTGRLDVLLALLNSRIIFTSFTYNICIVLYVHQYVVLRTVLWLFMACYALLLYRTGRIHYGVTKISRGVFNSLIALNLSLSLSLNISYLTFLF